MEAILCAMMECSQGAATFYPDLLRRIRQLRPFSAAGKNDPALWKAFQNVPQERQHHKDFMSFNTDTKMLKLTALGVTKANACADKCKAMLTVDETAAVGDAIVSALAGGPLTLAQLAAAVAELRPGTAEELCDATTTHERFQFVFTRVQPEGGEETVALREVDLTPVAPAQPAEGSAGARHAGRVPRGTPPLRGSMTVGEAEHLERYTEELARTAPVYVCPPPLTEGAELPPGVARCHHCSELTYTEGRTCSHVAAEGAAPCGATYCERCTDTCYPRFGAENMVAKCPKCCGTCTCKVCVCALLLWRCAALYERVFCSCMI